MPKDITRCDTNCTCYTCVLRHYRNDCDYGKPDGEDSWEETCVCGDLS